MKVQFIPDPEQKVLCFCQLLVPDFGDISHLVKFCECIYPVSCNRYPPETVYIPQAPFSLFNIWFNQVNGRAELFVSLTHTFQALIYISTYVSCYDLFHKGLLKLTEQGLTACN